MYELSDLALKAILEEWHPQGYDPLRTDVREWICSIESLCEKYGIPDMQRQLCAVGFIKKEHSPDLVWVLGGEMGLRPVPWDKFKSLMVEYDRK